MKVFNLLGKGVYGTIMCNERMEKISTVLNPKIAPNNSNWIGASKGTYITLNLKSDNSFFVETVKVWFFAGDNRSYEYTCEVSMDGMDYTQVSSKRNIQRMEEISLKRENPKSIRFSGGNTKNASFHFIHVEVMGCIVKNKGFQKDVKMDNLLKFPSVKGDILCNERKNLTKLVLDPNVPATNGNWVGASEGTAMTVVLKCEARFFIERIKVWFYAGDDRSYKYSCEYSKDGRIYMSAFKKRKVKTSDEIVIRQEGVKFLRFKGKNTKNQSFHFIHVEPIGYMIGGGEANRMKGEMGYNLLNEGMTGRIQCNERNGLADKVLHPRIRKNKNWIGASKGTSITVILDAKESFFLDKMKVWFYSGDNRTYWYSCEISEDGRNYQRLFNERKKQVHDEINIQRRNVKFLRFYGRNSKNPSFHFIHVEPIGYFGEVAMIGSRTTASGNLFTEGVVGTITCNERNEKISAVLDPNVQAQNSNWIGASKGTYITIMLNSKEQFFLEKMKVWVYAGDSRTYWYSCEYSEDGRNYVRVFRDREIKGSDEITIQKKNVRFLRFSGRNSNNPSFHFIHVEPIGWLTRSMFAAAKGEASGNLFEKGVFGSIICNERMEKINTVLNPHIPPKDDNWIGASKGSYITIMLNSKKRIYLEKMKVWFYAGDGRTYWYSAEYSTDGKNYVKIFHEKKIKGSDEVFIQKKDIKSFRFSGRNSKNPSFHFVHVEPIGYLIGDEMNALDRKSSSNLFTRGIVGNILCNERMEKISDVLNPLIEPNSNNWIGASKGTFITIILNSRERFFLEKMKVWFYAGDDRTYWYSCEYSQDGRNYFKLFHDRKIQGSDDITIQKKDIKFLRFSGRNTQNPSFHFIHVEPIGSMLKDHVERKGPSENLFKTGVVGSIVCNERMEKIGDVLNPSIHPINNNWIGASKGTFITLLLTSNEQFYLETMKVWFYAGDDRTYWYSCEYSQDGRNYIKLFHDRQIQGSDEIAIHKRDVKFLRFSGRNTKNPSFHFIHVEPMGYFVRNDKVVKKRVIGSNLFKSGVVGNIICNERMEKIGDVLNPNVRPNNNNWIGASKGTFITMILNSSERFFLEKVKVWFYTGDGRTYWYSAEYSTDGMNFVKLFNEKVIKGSDEVLIQRKDVKFLRFSGRNSTNPSFHFIHVEPIGYLMKDDDGKNEKVEKMMREKSKKGDEKLKIFLESLKLGDLFENFRKDGVVYEDLEFMEEDDLEKYVPLKFQRKRVYNEIQVRFNSSSSMDDVLVC